MFRTRTVLIFGLLTVSYSLSRAHSPSSPVLTKGFTLSHTLLRSFLLQSALYHGYWRVGPTCEGIVLCHGWNSHVFSSALFISNSLLIFFHRRELPKWCGQQSWAAHLVHKNLALFFPLISQRLHFSSSYLLGLLAKIKCSICSY